MESKLPNTPTRKPAVEDNSLLKQTYDKLTQIEGVAEVVAHFEIAEGFQTVQNVLNIASLIIVSVLFVVSRIGVEACKRIRVVQSLDKVIKRLIA